MQHEFWHDKWHTNQIGFHQQEVNKLLLKHWPSMDTQPNQTVLIPLCGKSLDVLWFVSQGLNVVGIELSEIALDELAQSLRDRFGLVVTKSTLEYNGTLFTTYCSEGVLLIAGDFFAVDKHLLTEWIGEIDLIYDRAAIVALPPTMRQQYAEHLVRLSDAAPQLLLSFDYNQDVRSGPPFSVPASEVHTHYQAHYQNIDLLEVRELIEHEPSFKEQGLNSFKQLVYRLTN